MIAALLAAVLLAGPVTLTGSAAPPSDDGVYPYPTPPGRVIYLLYLDQTKCPATAIAGDRCGTVSVQVPGDRRTSYSYQVQVSREQFLRLHVGDWFDLHSPAGMAT